MVDGKKRRKKIEAMMNARIERKHVNGEREIDTERSVGEKNERLSELVSDILRYTCVNI